jgi:BirA family biotin operon repressor/biotin-[acetyl-CoA-carboxylase] ligase
LPEPSLYNTIGDPFTELITVDSTNNYALTKVRAGLAQHGAAFFAHEQVAGRGQRGKSWTAPRDSSLILSVLVDPQPLTIGQQFQLSACVAVSACEFLQEKIGDNVFIKWPNDIYWRDRKAGGILIDNIIGTKNPGDTTKAGVFWQWAIAGIGININQDVFPSTLKNPVSLKQVTGKEFEPSKLAKELCKLINKYFLELVEGGFDQLYLKYHESLYKRGHHVKLKKGNRIFEAVIKKVSADGRLVVQHGIEESFDFGEIEWVLP